MYNILVAINLSGDGKEVCMEVIVMFLISVAASIVAYYICKWLDRDDDDN